MTSRKFLIIIAMIAVCANLFAQTTLVLQPNATDGKDALLASGSQGNINYGNHEEVTSAYWTVQGEWTAVRSVFEFDISQIPAGAVITSARLSLWSADLTSSNLQLHSGDNASYLKRVTSSWSENSVTWNNQPSTTTQNQVALATSTSSTQDYLNIDVTALYQDILTSGNNYGLMLQLVTENGYNSMIFASSDYSVAAKRPKLEITYTIGNTNCIVLQPDAATGKDALLASGSQGNINYGNHEEVTSAYWTVQGEWTAVRSVFEFDISQIPAGAVITSARLSLWSADLTSSNLQLHSGDNASYLKRVTSSWSENSVTWNNQPATTTQNQVALATSTSSTQDYLNIDVTALYQDILASGNNYGLMLQLISENGYNSMIFASSDYADATKKPKLEICYSLSPASCQIFQPNGTNGKDAFLASGSQAHINYANHEEVTSAYWTVQGEWTAVRSVFEFDISQIPTGALINSAKLSLWSADLTSSNLQLHSGNNASYLKRITSSWSENSVTWNNQPSTTTQNQVALSTSSFSTQDYLNIDVTALYQDILASGNNYGLMLQLITENGYNSMIFASSDYADAAKRPKLEICYSFSSGIHNTAAESNNMKVFPNPANGLVTVSFVESLSTMPKAVKVINMLGEEVGSYNLPQGANNLQISTLDFSKGAYIVQATDGEKSYTKRLIVQ